MTVYTVELDNGVSMDALLANSAPGGPSFSISVTTCSLPGVTTRGCFSVISRWAKWLVSLPPTLFLLLFFLAPSLIMVAASFRYPGEFGGLAPLFAIPGRDSGLTLEAYRFFSAISPTWKSSCAPLLWRA